MLSPIGAKLVRVQHHVHAMVLQRSTATTMSALRPSVRTSSYTLTHWSVAAPWSVAVPWSDVRPESVGSAWTAAAPVSQTCTCALEVAALVKDIYS